LTWALAELTGKSMGARFASRLALGAVAVVGAVVLATDPLNSAAFSKTWPLASVHYQIIPNGVLKFVGVVTALAAVISLIVTGVRARQSPGWQTLFLAIAASTVAIVLLDVMRVKLPANSAYAGICVAAAALHPHFDPVALGKLPKAADLLTIGIGQLGKLEHMGGHEGPSFAPQYSD